MRSLNLIGRVLRNLRRNNVTVSEYTDEDILDELNQAQNLIISQINTDKIMNIDFLTGIDTYPLTAGEIETISGEELMANFVTNDLVGVKNGVNSVFTFPTTPIEGTELIFMGGARLKKDTDYSITANTVTILALLPISTDTLYASYFEES